MLPQIEKMVKEHRKCCLLLTLLQKKLDGGEVIVNEERRCCFLLTLLPTDFAPIKSLVVDK